jgi:hypothetical protein
LLGLQAAEEAAARGDVRGARARLREEAAAGPETERAEARERLERLSLDLRAMVAAGLVLLVIALAAGATILRPH